ncbi:MAG: ribonuclease J [Rickettsiales bacterium]|jgi:ribonuclease J|nr:ribonuclease J [Rickettsiales bacterium]
MDTKNLNLGKYRENILFIPIGGSNEVGLNCNLYHYGGKWLMVDCGVGFTKLVPGVDLLVPDIAMLRKLRGDLLALFITHIHEDHIGAVEYLWPELEVPIYTSRFAKCFLREKLRECKYRNRVVINEFNNGDVIKLAPFEIEPIGLIHSAPEMSALLIKTRAGNVHHSGDWKFDPKCPAEQKLGVKRLKRLGANGEILATVCESTNIFNDLSPKSEVELFDSFYQIVKKKTGLVVFTTFASNVSRLKTIHDVAKKLGRKVVLVGTSLTRLVKVARSVDHLGSDYEFLREDEIKKYKKENLAVIATGCQGNVNAGIDKLANDSYRYLKLDERDCVIFSSRVIPGNEKELSMLYNRFADRDIEVITEKTDFVHVSGHYCLADLKKFYEYTKPKIAITVHGEHVQLLEHQRVARLCGIADVAKVRNGVILKITPERVEKIGQLDLQTMVVDGKRLLSLKSEIIKTREKMKSVGVVFVNLLISPKYRMLQSPVLSAPGGYDFLVSGTLRKMFMENIVSSYNESIIQINESRQINKGKFSSDGEKESFIAQRVRATINKLYDNDLGKKPVIELFFTKIVPTS